MPLNAGDVVVVEFPGVQNIKRRPAVILSSDEYHVARPDVIVGLITSQTTTAVGPTDCPLQDWKKAGLRKPSAFRSFLATLPRSGGQPRVIGRLSGRDWRAVQSRVFKALDLEGAIQN
jgi:mRNA interferase MazF